MQGPGSPYKTDGNTASDSSCDAAILNAFHLSSLFARREDGKTLAERLSQADLSVTPTKKHETAMSLMDRLSVEKKHDTTLSLVERVTAAAAAVAANAVTSAATTTTTSTNAADDELQQQPTKSLAERLAQSELGHDLTITQLNSGVSGGVMHLNNRGAEPHDDSMDDTKEGILKNQLQNCDSDNTEFIDSEQRVFNDGGASSQLASEADNIVSRTESQQISPLLLNNGVGKTSPVPDLVKLKKTLGLTNGARAWEVEMTRRGIKRRLDSNQVMGHGSLSLVSSQHLMTHPSMTSTPASVVPPSSGYCPAGVRSGSSPVALGGAGGGPSGSAAELENATAVSDATAAASKALYDDLRLSNERDKAQLIKVQLENENLKKELLMNLLAKINNGDAASTLLALKAVVS